MHTANYSARKRNCGWCLSLSLSLVISLSVYLSFMKGPKGVLVGGKGDILTLITALYWIVNDTLPPYVLLSSMNVNKISKKSNLDIYTTLENCLK